VLFCAIFLFLAPQKSLQDGSDVRPVSPRGHAYQKNRYAADYCISSALILSDRTQAIIVRAFFCTRENQDGRTMTLSIGDQCR
jgi:hypothetical protein